MSIPDLFSDAYRRSPITQAYSHNMNYSPLTSQDALQDYSRFTSSELERLARSQVTDLQAGLKDVADRKGMEEAVAKARAEASMSADVAQGIYGRRTEQMGLTDRQKMGAQQKLNLTREVAKAGASGDTRRTYNTMSRAADRAYSGLEDASFGQQAAMFGGLANAYVGKRINDANDKAAATARRNNAIGTVVSLIGMAAMASSEAYKDKVEEKPKLLDRLKKVRVDKWAYKGADANHIGPYAEEFNETFGVGRFSDAIDIVSMMGVTLGAVKELNEKVDKINGL